MKYLPGILLLLLLVGCNQSNENTEMQSRINALKSEKDSLIGLHQQLQNRIDSVNNTSDFWFKNQVDGRELLNAGIENPREYIIQSLKQQPELIPMEPVLGGKMTFRKIKLLGEGCLIAYYEDGHKAGRAIYSYTFPNDELIFELITTCTD